MTVKTFEFTVHDSRLPVSGKILVLADDTGEVVATLNAAEIEEKPPRFLRVDPDFFDIFESISGPKTPSVLRLFSYIAKSMQHGNILRIKHRQTAGVLKVSPHTISRCIRILEVAGLLAHRKDIERGWYMLHPDIIWRGHEGKKPKARESFLAARKASGYFVPEPPSDPADEPIPETG